MKSYTDVNGTPYTDADLDRWAAEHEAGYTGKHLTRPLPGRPVSVGESARTFTVRLGIERRRKLDAAAKEKNVSPSQIVRELIDSL